MSFALGIDVGGTKVLGGVVDNSGVIVKTARRDTPREGGLALTQTIAAVAKDLMEEFDVDAVGVSAAGFISSDRKTMLATPNIAGWNGVRLTDQLEELIGRKVVLENDANSAAWGEKRFGAGKNFDTVIMLTVGTGLGGGLIVDNSSIVAPMELALNLDTPVQFQKDIYVAAEFVVASSNMPQVMHFYVMPEKRFMHHQI